MANKRDYYEILGVSKTASKDEIKSIVGPFIKEYEISEENQKVMFDIIKE